MTTSEPVRREQGGMGAEEDAPEEEEGEGEDLFATEAGAPHVQEETGPGAHLRWVAGTEIGQEVRPAGSATEGQSGRGTAGKGRRAQGSEAHNEVSDHLNSLRTTAQSHA